MLIWLHALLLMMMEKIKASFMTSSISTRKKLQAFDIIPFCFMLALLCRHYLLVNAPSILSISVAPPTKISEIATNPSNCIATHEAIFERSRHAVID